MLALLVFLPVQYPLLPPILLPGATPTLPEKRYDFLLAFAVWEGNSSARAWESSYWAPPTTRPCLDY